MERIPNGFFGSSEFKRLPDGLSELARTAIHNFDIRSFSKDGPGIDYPMINRVLDFIVETVGDEFRHEDLMVLYMLTHERERELQDLWAPFTFKFDGELVPKSVFTQMYASISLLKCYQASLAIDNGQPLEALDLASYAGLALFHAAYFGGGHEQAHITSSKRQENAEARWVDDPSQRAKRLAQSLWPEANRHGWTADKLHQEITKRGEYASAGRVAKWLTSLRKTGLC